MGQLLADAFGSEIVPDVLPDDKMYYNIAKRIIGPSLQYNYDIVGDYARDVQTLLNEQAGLSIKGIKPEINQDRIAGIINKISNYETFDQGKWMLDEPVVNFSQSVVDDTIKANADFQYKAGLKPKIIRTEAGNCCDWCKGLAGVYAYPDVPKDVYRRHRFCRCTVDYYPGDGKKQDVWSKKWKDPDKDDKIILRKELNKIPNSTLNAYTLKKLEEKNWTPAFKAKAIKFYRETSKAGVEFSDHAVARTLQRVINDGLMNQEEIIQLLKGKAKYVQDDGRLIFNKGKVYFIRNQNTGDIVSVVVSDKIRKGWVKHDE
ncbi:hypothetical protein [Peptococcus niger]|uniref:Uncharacterized protein n=1 Tax=Peptococcus niger TaxID=2741 RepID=A0A1G6YCV2_PEPNI|nr:hypothetical protein [Peptococcus niger]SDD87823.1 hypothetical protein SAMN04489866_10930 [Peptococcus niger]